MRKIVLFFTLALLSFPSKAAHLVGGEISYKCISTGTNGNTYQIRLTIYRDCNSSGAPFDMQAPITIYGGSQSKYCCSNCHGGSGSHRRYSRCRKQPLLTDATERLYRKSDLYNQCNASARDTRLYHYLSTLLSKQHHIERGKFRNLG